VEGAAPGRRAVAAVLERVLRAHSGRGAALLGRRRLAPGAATRLDHAGGVAAVLGPAPAPSLSHLRSVMRSTRTRAARSRSDGGWDQSRAAGGPRGSPPARRAAPARRARRL